MLRVAGVVPESIVDGPGIRFALFLQGCPHRCPGCHNPETWDPRGGISVSTGTILEQIRSSRSIDGVTFSGGEPFVQAAALVPLAEALPALGLNLVLYSGYTFEELLQKSRVESAIGRLLGAAWLLVDGPFRQGERDLSLAFRGSRNQRILDLPASLARNEPVIWRSEAGGWKREQAGEGRSRPRHARR